MGDKIDAFFKFVCVLGDFLGEFGILGGNPPRR